MKRMAFEGLSLLLARRMQHFVRDDRGAMAPIMLMFFVMMILLGGIAVDVMRFETRRVAVQNTLDRATLAVANMTSSLAAEGFANTPEGRRARAEFLIADHFNKAGLEDNLQYVQLSDGLNYRVVEARADVMSRNIFMNLMGLPILNTLNGSVAQQKITDIEIMLVLDVSGSMGGAKINNLRIAARDFIDQVKRDDAENRISIGVIPYNAQVNLGRPLRSKYNATDIHNATDANGVQNSNCIEIPIGNDYSNVFQTLALSRSLRMPLMTAADTQSTSSNNDAYFNWRTSGEATLINTAAQRWCNPNSGTEITLPTISATKAKAGITALEASGNTSILLGMRWATALIDPSARDIYGALIDESRMDLNMRGRPFDYNSTRPDDDKTLKVIVLMTDGEHVAHMRVADPYKTGDATISFSYRPNGASVDSTDTATIWRSARGEFSVFFESKVLKDICKSKPFWLPESATWQNRPAGVSAPPRDCFARDREIHADEAVLMQWEGVWASVRMNYAVRQFFARPLGANNATNRTNVYNGVRKVLYEEYASAATMNNRLAANCLAARNAGILVYGIAFQAPVAGQNAIKSCTSIPAATYYFDVAETSKIQDAFRLIATNLSQLKLTQ